MSTTDNPATFHPGREGSAGGEVEILPHWSQMLRCSDGRAVFGYGETKDAAEANASEKRRLTEIEIAQPPMEQIETILDRCKETIYHDDMQRLVRLLCTQAAILTAEIKAMSIRLEGGR